MNELSKILSHCLKHKLAEKIDTRIAHYMMCIVNLFYFLQGKNHTNVRGKDVSGDLHDQMN